jgi:hydroxymethylpyrimidine/phosphomethylpyrimidine kinase
VTVVAEVVSDYPDIPWSSIRCWHRPRRRVRERRHGVAIRELLVPQSTVVTPNIPELRRLADDDDGDASLAECAQRLLDTAASTCS